MLLWRRTPFCGANCTISYSNCVSFQMICCPDSGSHVEESRTSPFNAELKKTYEALSGGITFQGIRLDKVRADRRPRARRGQKAQNQCSISTLRASCPVTRMGGTNVFTSSSGTIRSSRRRGLPKYVLNSTPTWHDCSEKYGAKRSATSRTGTSLSEQAIKGICLKLR